MFKRFRLRHYHDCVASLPDVFTGHRREFALLLAVWKEFHITDLATPSLTQRQAAILDVVFPRLPTLVEELQRVNQYFLLEQDARVERLMQRWQQQREQVSLDLYLTDADDVPVNTVRYLRRLQGLLWQHHYLLAPQEGEWRYRLSSLLYTDVATLARVLVP